MSLSGGLDADQLSKLSTTLFSAALGEITWETFLQELSTLSGGVCTHLLGFDARSGINIDFATAGYDPDYLQTYHQHYTALNAWGPGFIASPQQQFIDGNLMYPMEELQKTEFYNDWLVPQGRISRGGGALIFKSEQRFVALGGNIKESRADVLQNKWEGIVTQLIPQMTQAFEISRALAGAKLETAIVASEGMRQIPGIIVVSEKGYIIFANAVAQGMLGNGSPVGSDSHGHLTFRSLNDEERQVFDFGPSHVSRLLKEEAISFSAQSLDEETGVVFDLRFANLDPEASIHFPMETSLGLSSKCAILVISEAVKEIDTGEILTGQFKMTPTEVEIAQMLADGLDIRSISDTRSVSIHTVRHQVKSVMSKLGVKRQSEAAIKVNAIRTSNGGE
jgi:DNA-binding CsgD family transcriptional regulator